MLQNGYDARLLIVDDEPDIRMALAEILSMEGYSTEEAGSGLQALALLKRDSYDLMILDLNLPEMDGVEVMTRALEITPDLLIVILTGHGSLESAIAALHSKVADYLLKPVEAHMLIGTVARVLQERIEQVRRQNLIQVALNALRQVDVLSMPAPEPPSLLRVPPLTLDYEKRLVMVENDHRLVRKSLLTKNELTLLINFMSHPDQILPCRELVKVVWDRDLDEDQAQRKIRPYIFRLRRKIEPVPQHPRLIRTIRGRGYLFAPAEQ